MFKKTSWNIAFSLLSVISSAVSSFFLVPLYTGTMGVNAYGYVALALSFINISTILSLAITSMSTRFIVVALNREKERSNAYFNSILLACYVVAIILIIIFVIIAALLPVIASIEENYLMQVRIMILFMAGSLCCTVVATPFLSAQYYKDDLRLYYSFISLSQLSRIAVPYVLFDVIGSSLWLAFAACFCVDCVAVIVYRIAFTRFLPGLDINYRHASFELIKEVASSGMWVSVSKTGSVLLGTISTYLSNILVGVRAAGFFGIFNQLQSFIAMFTNALVSSLVPKILSSYANDSQEGFLIFCSRLLRYVGISVGACCGISIVFSLPFLNLWIGDSAEEYQSLVYLLLAYLPFAYPVEVLNQALVAQNRVKVPALATIAFGVANILLCILFCAVMNMGLMGLAIAQAITVSIRAWSFFPLYAVYPTRRILVKTYGAMLFAPIAMVVAFLLSNLVLPILPLPTNWLYLVIDAIVCSLVSLAGCLLFVKRSDWAIIRDIIFRSKESV